MASSTAQSAGQSTQAPSSSKVPTAEFIKAIGHRRTVYPLSDKDLPVSDDRIVEIVQEVLKVAPSSYNNQSGRIAIFLGDNHKQFWQIIRDVAMPMLQQAGEEAVNAMTQRFDMFSAAYGTISFWDDSEDVKASQDTHKSAAHMFDQWADHATGMLQFQVWTAVELEGLGANLQHMNMFPGVDAALQKAFDLPSTWSMKANMNIGKETTEHPAVPEKKPFSTTLKVFKS